MKTHLALLRGINVGGKRKILMADLRKLMENLGYSNPVTYIQSGNVLFTVAKTKTPENIADHISEAIKDQYGFSVPVIVLKTKDLQQAFINNPFPVNETTISQLHLTILKTTPLKENLTVINAADYLPDQFKITGPFIYLHLENKYHKTKLSNTFFEKKLATSATTRNWKTITKLLSLL